MEPAKEQIGKLIEAVEYWAAHHPAPDEPVLIVDSETYSARQIAEVIHVLMNDSRLCPEKSQKADKLPIEELITRMKGL